MQNEDWEVIKNYFEGVKVYDKAGFWFDSAEALLKLIKDIQSNPQLANVEKTVVLRNLVLSTSDYLNTADFPKAVTIGYTDEGLYKVSLGLGHETVRVPYESVMATIQDYLQRSDKLAALHNLSESAYQIQYEQYRKRERDNILERYTQMPHQWILTNLLKDISPYIHTPRKLRLFVETSTQEEKPIDINELRKRTEACVTSMDAIMELFEIAVDAEVKRRSQVYLSKNQ